MTEADKKMISDIFDSESMGYAYVYQTGIFDFSVS